jgi:Sugar (and other) transporter
MNVRAQAVGMASQTQNVANTIFNQFFPTFLNKDGFYAFYFFAGINLLLAAFVFFFVPETKHVSLEEIDVLFGGSNHLTQGENLLVETKLGIRPGNDEIVATEGKKPTDSAHIENSEV